MALFTRTSAEILDAALTKLTSTTPITATSPGSVARALTEVIANELGNFYNILDFNISQVNLSTASGSSLDLIGSLYNVQRKQIASVSSIDASVGAFYFYIDSPVSTTITIPGGTPVYTNTTYVGTQLGYTTTVDAVIPPGSTKAYTGLTPSVSNSVFTAGRNTITVIDSSYTPPAGVKVYCTNPKSIQAQTGQETDSSYRARIRQAVRTAAGGTETSIRMAALNVAGVRDALVVNTPYGLGTVKVVITPEDVTTATQTLTDAQTAIQAVSPEGVRLSVQPPLLLPVSLHCSIVIPSKNVDATSVISAATTSVLRFFNQPLAGSPLIYNKLIQTILDSSNYITDVMVTNLSVNGVPVLYQNYQPASDEQLVPGNVTIIQAVSP